MILEGFVDLLRYSYLSKTCNIEKEMNLITDLKEHEEKTVIHTCSLVHVETSSMPAFWATEANLAQDK